MCVRVCVRPTGQFRVLMDRRNRPRRSDSENGNRPGQSDFENGNRPHDVLAAFAVAEPATKNFYDFLFFFGPFPADCPGLIPGFFFFSFFRLFPAGCPGLITEFFFLFLFLFPALFWRAAQG
jgi:hypothetical protein